MGYSDTGGAVILRVLYFIFKLFFPIMASLTGQVRSDLFKQRISASKAGADFLSSSRRLVTNHQGAFLPASGAGRAGPS